MAARALVTGATGFTGSCLVRRLREEGWQVTALVRPGTSASELEQQGVEIRRADVGDAAQVTEEFPTCDVVFHLAAAFRTEHAERSEFDRVNVQGTRHLLEAARAAGVRRFVHCSTVGVHGEIEDPPAGEEYRFAPADHYQSSKLEGERLATEYGGRGLAITIVRPVGIYGPGDTRFLKLFRAIARGRFAMIGTGSVLYHLTYIDDLIDGFMLAGRCPTAVGEAFILAGPRWTTLREMVDIIAAAVGRAPPRLRLPVAPVHAAAAVCETACRALRVRPPLYRRRLDFFTKDRAFTIDKARRQLGYAPGVDPREGLARTASWYRENGLI